MSDPTHDPSGQPSPPPGPIQPSPTSAAHKLAVIAALALAAGAMYLAVSRTNTDDEAPVTVSARPDVVEHLIPFDGAQVLRQAELGVDLAPGYEGTLIVNGTEIPVDEQRLVPEQNQVFFAPGEGKAIQELPAGTNCVVVLAWKSSVGRGPQDEPFRWCFEVT